VPPKIDCTRAASARSHGEATSDPPPPQAATVTRRRMLIVVLMRAKLSAGDVETAIARPGERWHLDSG
jgi:hypothetical protein